MSLFRDLLVFQGYIADPTLLAELEARRGPVAAADPEPGSTPGALEPPPAR